MSVTKVQSKEDFDTLINTPGKLVIVDFFATWCGPCKVIGPKFAAMAAEFTERVLAIQVDVDTLEDVAEEAGVSAMPTFHAYRDGKKVNELVGASEAKLRAIFEEA